MTTVALLVVSALLWQEQFIGATWSMNPLHDSAIEIVHQDERIILRAAPGEEQFAAAWFSADRTSPFPVDAVVRLTIKVNSNAARIKCFTRRQGHSVYFVTETTVAPGAQWQSIAVPLSCAKPFYGSDFPACLTPGEEPALFLIVENMQSGGLNIEIDDISVLDKEEK
jgi:hypothetical protein